jgi:hypothetical protein
MNPVRKKFLSRVIADVLIMSDMLTRFVAPQH